MFLLMHLNLNQKFHFSELHSCRMFTRKILFFRPRAYFVKGKKRISTWPTFRCTRCLCQIKPDRKFDFVLVSFFQSLPAFVTIASKKFNDCVWLRRSSTVFTILLIGLSNAGDMVRWNSGYIQLRTWNFPRIRWCCLSASSTKWCILE